MNKNRFLIVSDIHIHDYPQRNPSPLYRLHQTRIVAQNIIKAAKETDCGVLCIAGDLIEKSIVRPYVQSEVKFFLDTLMAYFEEGFIIFGNHDQDNKSSDQSMSDSCISVMMPTNMYYADSKILKRGNSTIAFSNWKPQFDLGWIKEKVDLLITHATISYSSTDIVKSQVLDESKFDLCISGDIHKPAQAGKYISIGIPQRCKMSDSEQITGVIFDCETKKWNWVDLNPDQNLMKFEYTSIQSEEGWYEDIQTWKVYRPASNLTKRANTIQIPAWEEVNHLISDIIIQNNLQDIHTSVLSLAGNLESKEVDFNFTITRLFCKNWRSIEELELFFDEGDRVLLTGDNGAGKSSLIYAIKYALVENRFMKDFVSFGSRDCRTEITFIYQNKTNTIIRGTKTYGLIIDGESQKYNNKREFEEDVRIRFPFVEYLDIYFFDLEHNNLLGSMPTERKAEIVSKFYKLDKIDAMNETSELLLDKLNKDVEGLIKEKEELENKANFIKTELDKLEIPPQPKEYYEQSRDYYTDLQNRWRLWKDFEVKTAKLSAEIQVTSDLLFSVDSALKQMRDKSLIKSEVDTLNSELTIINEELSKLRNIDFLLNQASSKVNEVTQRGLKLKREMELLEQQKVCKVCGQEIKDTRDLDAHKQEILTQIVELREELLAQRENEGKIRKQAENSQQLRDSLQQKQKEITSKHSSLLVESREVDNKRAELASLQNKVNHLNQNLISLGTVEKVDVPDNLVDLMSEVVTFISIYERAERLTKDHQSCINGINDLSQKLVNFEQESEKLLKYIKLTGPTGDIYREILTRLAEQFSDNQVKYEVLTYNFRKKDYLDLASFYNNMGNWVSYVAASSGQKTVLDVNFLSKVVTRVGLLVMDEFLKHLDPKNHDVCIELIQNMNVGCVILSSHAESLSNFNNKSCKLKLNSSGATLVNLE